MTRKKYDIPSRLPAVTTKSAAQPATVMSSIKSVDIQSIGKFIVSEKLKEKIDYLHRVVGSVEWSGILVYKIESGSIKDMENLVFTGVNLYPMDIGSAAFTTFKYDSALMDMYDVIPEAMEMNLGLVHTH